MGLITSVAEAGSIRKGGTQSRTANISSLGNFNDVLRGKVSGGTEAMDAIFEEAAALYGLPSQLVKAVAKAESGFNPNAVSHAGAMGVMQLMPGTARSLGVSDPFDARQNIMGGAKYLKENLDRFGNVELALAAYNAGPGAVNKYGGIPPYQETQNYVKKVTSYMGQSPIHTGRMVNTGMQGENPLSGTGALTGSDYMLGLDSLSGTHSLLASNSLPGTASLFGTGPLSGRNLLSGAGLSVSQDGDTVTMDKESFASLIQLLRIQRMMDANRSVGAMNI